jgi:hypothetical protein
MPKITLANIEGSNNELFQGNREETRAKRLFLPRKRNEWKEKLLALLFLLANKRTARRDKMKVDHFIRQTIEWISINNDDEEGGRGTERRRSRFQKKAHEEGWKTSARASSWSSAPKVKRLFFLLCVWVTNAIHMLTLPQEKDTTPGLSFLEHLSSSLFFVNKRLSFDEHVSDMLFF